DVAELTYDALDESAALRHVRDASAGGTVLFVGTTRDTFQGKRVLRLEYEAYSKLAIKTLESILRRSRSMEWPPPAPLTNSSSSRSLASTSRTQAPDQPIPASQQVTRIFIAHRLGHVPVGEPSILVCASAPHRRRAFEVAEWALEQVKKDVQVWKREVY
ncbi:Molybdopterin biosynthesis MoaE, partial [Ceraceosorus guamensis]